MNELFRTPVGIEKLKQPIDHSHKVTMIGSCFSENIYRKLKEYRFNVICNPNGVLYNPLSITAVLDRLLQKKTYIKEDLFFHNDLWMSFDHHSTFNHTDDKLCLQKINSGFLSAETFLKNTDLLMLTFGSAFVYQLSENNKVAANCHKLPESKFIRRLASVDEIVSSCCDIFNKLRQANPALNILLTVSPVRHLRDKAHENTVSKSHLIAAVYRLENIFERVYYFPSFEIMMDELRDYRFYASDMIHPSDTAIEFLWNRFRQFCISKSSNEFIERYERIIAARAHRIMFPGTAAAKEFANSQIRTLDALKDGFPLIDLSADYEWFRNLSK